MAYFTTIQAQSSSISKAQKVYENGSFARWYIDITRGDGETLSVAIDGLAENANTSSIKTGVISHLTTNVVYYVEPVMSSSIDTSVIGSLS